MKSVIVKLANLPGARERFSHLHYNTVQNVYEAISDNIFVFSARNCNLRWMTFMYLIFTYFRATFLFREFEVEIRRGIANRSFFEVIRFRESTNWCSFIVNLHFFILFIYNGIETQQITG